MTQKMFGAMTAIAAVVVYGAVTGAQAPAPVAGAAAGGEDPAGRRARLRVRHHEGRNRLRPEERTGQPARSPAARRRHGQVQPRRRHHPPRSDQREAGRSGAGAVARLHAGDLLHHLRLRHPDDRRRDPESAPRPGRPEHDERSRAAAASPVRAPTAVASVPATSSSSRTRSRTAGAASPTTSSI